MLLKHDDLGRGYRARQAGFRRLHIVLPRPRERSPKPPAFRGIGDHGRHQYQRRPRARHVGSAWRQEHHQRHGRAGFQEIHRPVPPQQAARRSQGQGRSAERRPAPVETLQVLGDARSRAHLQDRDQQGQGRSGEDQERQDQGPAAEGRPDHCAADAARRHRLPAARQAGG